MTHINWSETNTEDFDSVELEILNATQTTLENEFNGINPKTICDALNNVWVKGVTETELLTLVREQLSA